MSLSWIVTVVECPAVMSSMASLPSSSPALLMAEIELDPSLRPRMNAVPVLVARRGGDLAVPAGAGLVAGVFCTGVEARDITGVGAAEVSWLVRPEVSAD